MILKLGLGGSGDDSGGGPPEVDEPNWLTEDGSNWLTEDGSLWLLE